MQTINIVTVISGKETQCLATKVEDVNPRNNQPYAVYSIVDMKLDGEPVLKYVSAKDKVLREAEREQFEQEYQAEMQKALDAWKLRNPDADEDDQAAYVAHWETTAPARRLRNMRTNGLHAQIKDGDQTYEAYLLPEQSGQALAKFRTYVPRDGVSTETEAVNPF
jgi:hypothetical protein